MRYGRFSEDGREFLVEDPATPRPWINYLHNSEYFATISANGGGISYVRSPLHGRVTRYRINDVPPDRPGKYLYLRDAATGSFWSLTWQPVGRDRRRYRVAHGFGYTRAEADVEGIASEAAFFVPRDLALEVWRVRLRNGGAAPRRLSLFAYVELCLGHALVDLVNQCDDQHFNRVRIDRGRNAILATKTYWVTGTAGTQYQENKSWDRWAFLSSDHPVAGYETVRERFLGPYRSESNPVAVETGEMSGRETDFGNAVGALRVDLELAPGGEQTVLFNLGVLPKRDDRAAPGRPRKYLDLAAVDRELRAVRALWDRRLGHVVVRTPDADMDLFLNGWSPYQARVAFDVGRVASFYYWGISRGFGFRDTAQDTVGIVVHDPEKVRERIGLLARQIFPDGRVYHHFYGDGQGQVTTHCDDPLWFVLAVSEYVKETGDFAILERVEPFAGGAGEGTILGRLAAVAGFASRNLAPGGLPVFGRGDWNDTLDYIGGEGGGESVWGGMFYAAMMDRLAGLAARAGDRGLERKASLLRDRLRRTLDARCWDGAWYVRAFGEGGRAIGSRRNRAGRIFINAQSWAVLCGLDPARGRRAMDSLRERLDTPFGPKICAPAFREIDPKIGLITRCVAGKKENAAVFLHPTAWAIQAECRLGRGGRAFGYYKKLLPNSVDSDVFQAEPYVYSQYITSDEHPTAGMASHSWQTGTAAWMYHVAVSHLLGVRADYDGLVVDPVIPAGWRRFEVEREFRGTRYRISVENPAGVERGVKRILVDGRRIAGNVLPVASKRTCRVEVEMG